MVFSSLFFLFFFLPLVLFSYFITPKRLRNLHLLLASLFFYAWGEGLYVLLMLFVVVANYFLGKAFQSGEARFRRPLLFLGIAFNLLPLIYFKYTGFFLDSFGAPAGLASFFSATGAIHLPLGISFFTFQALSYLIDTYRKTTPPQQNFINLGLYIALFPQLIAGPIVRYHDIARQLCSRKVTLEGFCLGIERFIIGLAKKVLLANTLGLMADSVFSCPPSSLPTFAVWIGAISYTLQIYYDFSGYSDMAIGLGRMFGFTFLENFNFPYISRSIQEFWRRWHISLSNWFRDYLYIPLGGNRKGSWRTIGNLYLVFFLCGLWHGASWNFVVWGLFHGCFLVLERGRWGSILGRAPVFIGHAYVLMVVLVGWIFFRADTLSQAVELLAVLVGGQQTSLMPYAVLLRLDALYCVTLGCSLFFMVPPPAWLREKVQSIVPAVSGRITTLWPSLKFFCLCLLFTLSAASLATGVYNPFIYFRF
ncbi:MAG: MBOAT family O-acyltransferase [Desulforhopalus sp.]